MPNTSLVLDSRSRESKVCVIVPALFGAVSRLLFGVEGERQQVHARAAGVTPGFADLAVKQVKVAGRSCGAQHVSNCLGWKAKKQVKCTVSPFSTPPFSFPSGELHLACHVKLIPGQ